MCAPVIAAAMMVAGMAMQAESARKEQEAQNKALEYNANVLESNAKTRELQAINAEKIGAIEKSELKSSVISDIGTQRAGFGASGVVVDEGSTFDVVKATQIQGAQDAMTLQYNIEQEAFGYRAEASNLRLQATGLRQQKRSPEEAAQTSLIGSGLSVGSSFFGGK